MTGYRSGVPENWFVDPVNLGVPGVRRPAPVEEETALAWHRSTERSPHHPKGPAGPFFFGGFSHPGAALRGSTFFQRLVQASLAPMRPQGFPQHTIAGAFEPSVNPLDLRRIAHSRTGSARLFQGVHQLDSR